VNTPPTMPLQRKIQLFSGALLLAWLLTAFAWVWFARDLDIKIGEWPIHFWMAAQGSLLLFLLITVLNAWYHNKIDHQVDEHEADG
jgi:putative solute:sodium symporter small subunit